MTIVCGKEVTLPDFKDEVAVITYVRDFLLEQGRSSMDLSSLCQFRGEDNTACAIGCLVSDDEARLIGEGNTAMMVYTHKKGLDRRLFQKLQSIHDRDSVSEWKGQFDKLIKEYS